MDTLKLTFADGTSKSEKVPADFEIVFADGELRGPGFVYPSGTIAEARIVETRKGPDLVAESAPVKPRPKPKAAARPSREQRKHPAGPQASELREAGKKPQAAEKHP